MKYVANLSDIIIMVAEEYGIPANILTSPDVRTASVARARHVAIYLACKLTWMSKDSIAVCFNLRDHSSLFYGFNKISVALANDVELKRQVGSLTKRLEEPK